MKACVMLFSILSTISSYSEPTSNTKTNNHQKLLDAICIVETGCDNTKVGADGEIGSYQILPAYWKDALEFDPSIGGEYEDVIDDEYARKVILAYWNRYATERRIGRPVTNEDRARIHNGGPNGWKKKATEIYWEKVKSHL